MSRTVKLAIAGGIAVVGIIVLVLAIVRLGSVRGYVADHYTRTSGGGESVVYTASSSPRTVYDDIRHAHRPADTIIEEGGYFLRYSDDIVAITAEPNGGSRIHIDDERRGYAVWYPYIGSRWGTYGVPGETFRGGGPGVGK